MREINLQIRSAISIFLLLLITPVQADTITVGLEDGYDFHTIQAGIDAAGGWDTVLVAPGVYLVSEPITFRRKPLTVISEAGPDQTTIQMGRSRVDTNRSCIVIFEDMETQAFILDGFTITGGKGFRIQDTYLEQWHGGGIFFENSSATIKNCVITRNSTAYGGGISCIRMSFPRFINCIISENSATSSGGGIHSYMSSPILINCTFIGNSARAGGGMCNEDSSPILAHCTFNGNSAATSGGGVVIAGSNSILLNCTFIGNSAESFGGGLINYSGDDISVITNCTFSRNSALYGGGGMCNWFEGNAILTNCTFSENRAEFGGGFDCMQDSNMTLIDCTFNDNRAETDGGGSTNSSCNTSLTNCTFSNNISEEYGGGMSNWSSNITLTNCTFNENSTGWDGGGMRNAGSELILTDCLFKSNSAQGYGGGICNRGSNNMILNYCNFSDNLSEYGGAMSNRYYNNLVLLNCILTCNSADSGGGGICNGDSSLEINNSIFSGNLAAVNGGALYSLSDSILTVTNCTFFGNLAQNGNAFASVYNRFSENITEIINCIVWDGVNGIWNSDDDSTIGITYSNIQGGQVGIYDPYETVTWGEGNIDTDPLFVEPGYWDPNDTPDDPNDDFWVDGDYHLKSQVGRWDPESGSWVIDDVTSPCIDAGDPNSPVSNEPEPNGGRINMGAYGGTQEASKSPSN